MLVRLSKILSERGICSRREADRYIEAGLVSVDGEVISTLGTKVSPNAKVKLLPEAQKFQNEKVTILLHKPVGYASMQTDKEYPIAVDLITPENQFDEGELPSMEKLGVAGRLDIESKGLLVFSQDGAIIKRMIGPDAEMEKEYLVRFEGEITPEKIQWLEYGLMLDGEQLKEAKIDQLEEGLLRVVLIQGKKRQIRRMLELVDLYVTSLKRVRIGDVRLGKLPMGHWRLLRKDEQF
jgi:23S rRNA pseudouridine2604 synthase